MSNEIFRAIVSLLDAGGRGALATIVRTQGSTPGKEAMKLLVMEDGSVVGTVGGGCLEAEVWEAAREVMEKGSPRSLRFLLNERDYPDSGLLCGGSVEVYIEPIGAPTVFLFGGGHISGAILKAAREVGFRVVIIDDREEFANRGRFPLADDVVCERFTEVTKRLPIRADSFCVVVTRGHQHDAEVLRAICRCPQRYTAMIGSRSKARILKGQLAEEGINEKWLREVRCPAGLSIGARTHEEIAISVVAEMIAVRRGITDRERSFADDSDVVRARITSRAGNRPRRGGGVAKGGHGASERTQPGARPSKESIDRRRKGTSSRMGRRPDDRGRHGSP